MSVMINENTENKMHPQKFALYLGIASIIMLFAALTSAYIVRSHQNDWIVFTLPRIFWINTLIIALSSATMQWAVFSFKKYQYGNYKIALALTVSLAIAFTFGQYEGWLKLASIGMFLDGNPAGSFIYVISFIHLLHIFGGLVFLISSLVRSLYKQFNPNKFLYVQLMATYWHFVGILWLYLMIFFTIKIA
ncbi:MAG: cytochrome c oxidase subunit 3 [Pseudomonadota bacterium]